MNPLERFIAWHLSRGESWQTILSDWIAVHGNLVAGGYAAQRAYFLPVYNRVSAINRGVQNLNAAPGGQTVGQAFPGAVAPTGAATVSLLVTIRKASGQLVYRPLTLRVDAGDSIQQVRDDAMASAAQLASDSDGTVEDLEFVLGGTRV